MAKQAELTQDQKVEQVFELVDDSQVLKGHLRIRSTYPELSDKKHALSSEDAKHLAKRLAMDKGLADPVVKSTRITYCDPKTYQQAAFRRGTVPAKLEPVLEVVLHSETINGSQFAGDSLL